MLGEFITKILGLVLGYVYPAFECFKTIERNRHGSEHLMFWCQYWVIIAILTAVEKFCDIFVSWVPLYGEAKLAFIVYLWHPKTKGTSYIYNRVVRPFMAQHEIDFEKRLQGMLTKSIDLLLFYIKHFTDKGQSIAFEILNHILSCSMGSSTTPEKVDKIVSEGTKRRMVASPTPLASPKPSGWKGRSIFKRSTSSGNSRAEDMDDDDEFQLSKIEEALRAAGVNLREISRPNTRNRFTRSQTFR